VHPAGQTPAPPEQATSGARPAEPAQRAGEGETAAALRRADLFMAELLGRARTEEARPLPAPPRHAPESTPVIPLQPAPAAPVPAPPAVVAPEPSLVIGRLRVEVVSPAPAAPAPASRPITRVVGGSRRAAPGLPGSRWFGLGQI